MFAVTRMWESLSGRRSSAQAFATMRSRIDKFRDLLAANCRAMELIADAGEKLGGEYLFDIQYLRTLADELEKTVRRIVYDLNDMTGDRYLDLMKVVDRLDLQIRMCLEGGIAPSVGETVFNLSELGQDLCDVVGEKMARLGDLYNHFPSAVPNGFAISAYACRRFLEENGISDRIDSLLGEPGSPLESVDRVARQIQDTIREGTLPRDIARSITRSVNAIERKRIWSRAKKRFAVRSSALGEDGALTFAGLHDTVLNVPAERILDAYKSVVASLFSTSALIYRKDHNISPLKAQMGVGCILMVPAVASGVIYTVDPMHPKEDRLVLTAALGYGKSVVEGGQPVDHFVISRRDPHVILSKKIAIKEHMYVSDPEGGLKSVSVPAGDRNRPSISNDTLFRLAELALRVERLMKCAQDIEWAQDPDGRLFLLQSRSLRLSVASEQAIERIVDLEVKYPVLFKGRGEVACRGIGAGPVCVVQSAEDRSHFPDGAVLVSKYASPQLSSMVPRASAVITDVGAATGHLATITREYRVPALVGASIGTTTLTNGMEITVDAEESIVYQGIVPELVQYQLLQSSSYEDAFEFRILRRLLRNIAPLHLHDPRSKQFSPDFCATYHDIIRFAHEKAVTELGTKHGIKVSRRCAQCQQVDLNVPLDLLVIYLDREDTSAIPQTKIDPDKISCAPLRALLEGLTSPGAWMTEPADMDFESFMSSATGPLAADVPTASGTVEQNLAIVSREYLNLSLRLGYHFNVIDCYMSDNLNDNYIYFRFAGGMTDITRRSRRTRLIGIILDKYDFIAETSGDLIIARIKNLPREMMQFRLSMIGRLIGFTRQLDTFLKSDDHIEYYATLFLEGRGISTGTDTTTSDQSETFRKETPA